MFHGDLLHAVKCLIPSRASGKTINKWRNEMRVCIFFSQSRTVDNSLNLDTCSGSAEEAENYVCRLSLGQLFVYLSLHVCKCVFVYLAIPVILFNVFQLFVCARKCYTKSSQTDPVLFNVSLNWLFLCIFYQRHFSIWHVLTACRYMNVCLYLCMCSVVAPPASLQALGLMTAPLFSVRKRTALCVSEE